jgi:hypothetical protein
MWGQGGIRCLTKDSSQWVSLLANISGLFYSHAIEANYIDKRDFYSYNIWKLHKQDIRLLFACYVVLIN